jgi:hypothetical protein
MSTLPLFPEERRIELHVTLDWSKQRITFDWLRYHTDKKLAHGAVWVAGEMLHWRITGDGEPDNFDCLIEPLPIEVAVRYVARRFPVAKRNVTIFGRKFSPILNGWQRELIGKFRDPWLLLGQEILSMGEELVSARSHPPLAEPGLDPEAVHLLEKWARR